MYNLLLTQHPAACPNLKIPKLCIAVLYSTLIHNLQYKICLGGKKKKKIPFLNRSPTGTKFGSLTRVEVDVISALLSIHCTAFQASSELIGIGFPHHSFTDFMSFIKSKFKRGY